MKNKILSLIIIILFILNTISYADELDWEAEVTYQEIQEELLQASTDVADEPKINSRAAVVIDRNSKEVLYKKNMNVKKAMASTTKIMTAIILIEQGDLLKQVEISKKAASIGGSRLGLKTGDKITLNDLLYGLMLKSGNDAAIAIAEEIGGSVEDFSKLMNNKAMELNLKNTHFVTPHGLDDDNHYTTAYELAMLTDYALKNKKFADVVNTKYYTVKINGYAKDISNTNELLGVLEGVNGVKTGFTNNAGRCLVTSTIRNNFNIITVVLGADTKKYRTKDSANLIQYVYKNFEQVNIKSKIEEEFKNWCIKNKNYVFVNKGIDSYAEIELEKILQETYPVLKEKIKDIKIEIEVNNVLEAPINKGDVVGKIIVKIDEKEIYNVNIVVKENIKKKNVFTYMFDFFKDYGEYVEMGLQF